MKKLVFSLIVLVTLGFLACIAAYSLLSGKSVPAAESYIQGIDISHHNGAIDWRALSGTDVRFVYMKATEGGDFVDPKFKTNWKRAGETSILRGAYHFFTLCRTAEQQAANFIRVTGDMNGALIPALDLEHMGPCREGPTLSRPDLEIAKYIDIIEAHYGARPLLYTTQEFHDRYLVDLDGEKYWARSIFRPPSFRQKEWVVWQHHHQGRRAGIKGHVDLNAFRGSDDDLQNLRMRGRIPN